MNPSEIVALSQNIEKLGIIGVLVLVTILLGYAAFYFRKELMSVHLQREKETRDLRSDGGGLGYPSSEVRPARYRRHRLYSQPTRKLIL